jgi:hypothetical protein
MTTSEATYILHYSGTRALAERQGWFNAPAIDTQSDAFQKPRQELPCKSLGNPPLSQGQFILLDGKNRDG